MTTITLWLLIMTTLSDRGGPLVVDRFNDKFECESTRAAIEKGSDDKRGMTYLRGICVQAKVAR